MAVEYSTREIIGGLNATEEKYAPTLLYVSGRLEILKRMPRISVIGSRKATSRGIDIARMIARIIVERRGVVVSGLAAGIDTAAHLGALEAGGDTIAVIGTSLDEAYPKQNRELQARLAHEQLVVTQFAVGVPTTPKNFPIRNRTMALLSHASIIVEAGSKSGTEHQGWEAIRLGRQLFLPKRLVDAPFDWPKKMAAYGAQVFETPGDLKDLIDEFVPVNADEASSAVPF